MAKAPVVKFPRIQAGFYTVTLEGELVGYISKKTEGKEVSWMIFNTNEPDLDMDSLPASMMVEETELFREAKEYSKEFFVNQPKMTQEVETVELQVPEWNEENTESDFFDNVNEYEEAESELVAV